MNGSRAHWIECDAYDRAAFERLRADSPSLRELAERGGKLLPHFDGFLLDLFSLFFKMNQIVYPPQSVVPSAAFYRTVLEVIRKTPALDVARQRTVLDETASGLAAALLGERLLGLLRSEKLLTRAEMLDFWNLHQQEQSLAEQEEQIRSAGELRSGAGEGAGARRIAELEAHLQREKRNAELHLEHQARRVRQTLEDGLRRQRSRVEREVARTAADLESSGEEAESWGVALGGGHRMPPATRIELGKRLATNPKLRRMAELVGRMRENARALRRKLYERAPAEIYEIERGALLHRLLPAEMIALAHPLLRRNFYRRLIEGELLVYALRDQEQKGRGPMIVCLDGSSSMEGEREIWAKAVTLTLLDIARRQRRRFCSIAFSSADTPLQIIEMDTRARGRDDLREVFELAEYFPGGGTDFQKPLDAAVERLRRAPGRRGDIVFITDGECQVDPRWLDAFQATKKELGFSLYSVLIDVERHSLGPLPQLSDRITSVSQLTSEGTRDIFLEI